MGSSTTTTKGARRSTKESGTHAIRDCVEASNGQRAAVYLRRSAMDERGDSARITVITAVLTGETIHYKTKT